MDNGKFDNLMSLTIPETAPTLEDPQDLGQGYVYLCITLSYHYDDDSRSTVSLGKENKQMNQVLTV